MRVLTAGLEGQRFASQVPNGGCDEDLVTGPCAIPGTWLYALPPASGGLCRPEVGVPVPARHGADLEVGVPGPCTTPGTRL